MRKVVQHFVKVCKHKHYVRQYCWKLGLYKQGILHDISKFSPIEFLESVKYYQGNRSPIDACKEDKGYSMAWLHHKGRNPHHYEYWQDNFDKGGEPLQMPFKYVLEMLCDYLGAGRAYMGKQFTYEKELDWWIEKKKKGLAMHPQTKIFLDYCLIDLVCYDEDYVLDIDRLKRIYDMLSEVYNKERK